VIGDARPIYEPSKRRLTWPNGAIATTYSADEPERLRGPQHDCAWTDELAAWRYPEAWDMLMFGLRLGEGRIRARIAGIPGDSPGLDAAGGLGHARTRRRRRPDLTAHHEAQPGLGGAAECHGRASIGLQRPARRRLAGVARGGS
jgi:hypothetical protein